MPNDAPVVVSAEHERAQLRAIIDAAPVMLYQWMLTAAGEARFTFVSRGCEQIYGRTPEQMLADMRYSMEVVHPEDMPEFERAVATSARLLQPFSWEGRIHLPEGVVKWLRACSIPSRLDDGGTRWEGVILDISEQRRADDARRASERERSALVAQLSAQNETLRRQAEALRQLGTPIVPLTRGAIALPLIGDIDSARAELVVQALLDGVARHRARVAVIDVTGVPGLDAFGAETLVRAGQAVRMLGATAVLTGLQPAAATTLADLELGLHGLKTLSSFQDGIAFALAAADRAAAGAP